ncbi:MAG: BON domain-containing protein [Chloroflexi bacterium]|nr:BON domain-containing protein [Chloroflexota bacterium]
MPFTRQPYPEREPNPRSFPVGNEPELPGKVKRDDSTIKSDIESALFYDNMVNSYQVKVDVKDGVVTLAGTVDSEEEKRLAEEDVKAVPGVLQVTNQLVAKT